MKRISLLLLVLLTALSARAKGIQAGPWVTDASDSTLTILWISELPGTAYVELEDGRTLYDVFAGRRIFRRLDVECDARYNIHLRMFNTGGEKEFSCTLQAGD